MKNTAQKYLSLIKEFLPGWDGADIGHTAARDWYVGLTLGVGLSLGLVVLGVLHFFAASHTINEPPENVQTHSFPIDEEKILDTKKRFDIRAEKFDTFSSQISDAPNPGREAAPRGAGDAVKLGPVNVTE